METRSTDLHPGMIPMVTVAKEVATPVETNRPQEEEDLLKNLPVCSTISRRARKQNSNQANKWLFVFSILTGVAVLATVMYLLLSI
jgi:hypothetical protein|tara:strand:+ start:621 stop:878 length:258 start_codon:yes stop_codon:yes gene_type:complete